MTKICSQSIHLDKATKCIVKVNVIYYTVFIFLRSEFLDLTIYALAQVFLLRFTHLQRVICCPLSEKVPRLDHLTKHIHQKLVKHQR